MHRQGLDEVCQRRTEAPTPHRDVDALQHGQRLATDELHCGDLGGGAVDLNVGG
jgi:hypothetical protein